MRLLTDSAAIWSQLTLTTGCDGMAEAGTGSGVFDSVQASFGGIITRDCLRDRIRASCDDCAPMLYWTISSSKRFLFIERCELHKY